MFVYIRKTSKRRETQRGWQAVAVRMKDENQENPKSSSKVNRIQAVCCNPIPRSQRSEFL